MDNQQKLDDLVRQWAREIPLYEKRSYALAEPDGQPVTGQMARWPFITKRDIRQGFPGNFLRHPAELDRLVDSGAAELEFTSGTSEERTPLILPSGWWREQEERALRLNSKVAAVLDANPAARRVSIVSPMCNNDISYTGVPSHEDRIVGNSLFVCLSRFPFMMGRRELQRMADETADWSPVFLDLDPVYGVVFALHCERQGIRIPSLRFILASYEFVSAVHRRVLERAFGVPVYNLYGSTETGHLMMETEPGIMTPSTETAFLELLPPARSAADGTELRELVVTTLTNPYMPLIRYRIGDLVQSLAIGHRTQFIVHGRAADCFVTDPGHWVTTWQVDQCIARTAGIAHYQLIENAPGDFLLRYIPDSEPLVDAEAQRLRQCLEQLLHARSAIVLEKTEMLLPEKSGKFRLGYSKRE